MIENNIITIILILSSLVATSILLNILIIKKMVKSRQEMEQGMLPIESIPNLTAHNLVSKTDQPLNKKEEKVYIFLATNCPKCKSKLNMLDKLNKAALQHGISLYIVLHDRMQNIEAFFQTTQLHNQVWLLGHSEYLQLNPKEASPTYLFINDEDQVEGQGMIGDQSWQYFTSQVFEEAA